MIGNRITRKMMEVRDGSVDAARYVGGSAGEFVGRKINDAIGVVGELPDDVRAGFKFTSESTSSALGAASLALRGRLDRLSGSEPPEPGVDAGTQTEFDDVQLTELRYKFIEKATAFPADPELEAIEARKSTETESVLESFRGELSRMRDELRKEKLKYEDLEGGLRGKDGKIAELEAENAALAGDKEKLRVDLERLQNVAAVSDIVSPPGSVPGPPVRVFHPHMVQVFPAPVPGMVPVFPVPYYQGGGAPAPVYRDQFGGTLGEHGVHYPPQTSRTPHSSPQRPDADRVDDGAAKEKRDREGRA